MRKRSLIRTLTSSLTASLLTVAVFSAAPSAALQIDEAAFIQPRVSNYDDLNLGSFFYPTPAVINGDTYEGGTRQEMSYLRDSSLCRGGIEDCFGRNNVGDTPFSQWVDITLAQAAPAVGLWINPILETSVVRIEFFDPLDNLISAANVGLGFYGWEHGLGIRRVRLTDILDDGRIFTFDDLTVETVPEPGSASLLVLGLLGLSRRWIRSSSDPRLRAGRSFRCRAGSCDIAHAATS